MVSAAELCRELTRVQPDHYVRSQRVKEFPMLIKINEASLLESACIVSCEWGKENGHCDDHAVALPRVKRLSYDLASVSQKRFSPDWISL